MNCCRDTLVFLLVAGLAGCGARAHAPRDGSAADGLDAPGDRSDSQAADRSAGLSDLAGDQDVTLMDAPAEGVASETHPAVCGNGVIEGSEQCDP
ncbi:MAG TPA: hypothetical protein VNO55_02240, partial [Polyangia bacterium]|nr:hypothetical protein [Polyangia bacterium]